MTVAPSPLLTGPETARYLGIKPQTLRKWRLTGHGPPFVRIGESPRSRVAYRVSDIEAWVAARTFESTAAETVARWGADEATNDGPPGSREPAGPPGCPHPRRTP
jgi:predicted DNA-binding transcriptional regulator AlpA